MESNRIKAAKLIADLEWKASPICRAHDNAFLPHAEGIKTLLNGHITKIGYGYPIMAECTIGDGIHDDKAGRNMYSNMYTIRYYFGNHNIVITKSTVHSIHEKGYSLLGFPENFKDWRRKDLKKIDGFWKRQAIYKDLEIEEILKKIINKPWETYYNVNQEKENLEFLSCMKNMLIDRMIEENAIYWSENKQKYEDINFQRYKK